jgi:hypothetical protein
MTDTTSAYISDFHLPKDSGWRCYIVGKPGQSGCLVLHATEGTVPNAFWRLMQFLVLGFHWHHEQST